MSDLAIFRAQKDGYFKMSPDSPIPPEARASFQGLRYYPENADLRLLVRIKEFEPKEPIRMITSTGGVQVYLRGAAFRSRSRAARRR
jgi:uncharacterized protein